MPIAGADGGAPGLQPKSGTLGQIELYAGNNGAKRIYASRRLAAKKERIRFGSAG